MCKQSKTKFIDSARYMATLLSNLFDDLTEEIHKINCKGCDRFLEYKSVNDNLTRYRCLPCDKVYSRKIDEALKKRFENTFIISNNDINKFILLLKKGTYPYERMDE